MQAGQPRGDAEAPKDLATTEPGAVSLESGTGSIQDLARTLVEMATTDEDR
jgi:hypothetical protein